MTASGEQHEEQRKEVLCYCVLIYVERRTMATPLPSIECSAQPLSISFHPYKEIVAAGLVDGTIEIHDLIAPPLPNLKEDDSKNNNDDDSMDSDNEEDEVADTILASITVAKEVPQSKMDTKMLAKSDSTTTSQVKQLKVQAVDVSYSQTLPQITIVTMVIIKEEGNIYTQHAIMDR